MKGCAWACGGTVLRFVLAIEAQKHRLNVLMQAPVVGGNAGGPPDWAGRREKGKSAPLEMEALAAFAGKLARRYRPGGTLAVEQGWGSRDGVRAWELDNEPEMDRTHWKGQAADLAPADENIRDTLAWASAANRFVASVDERNRQQLFACSVAPPCMWLTM